MLSLIVPTITVLVIIYGIVKKLPVLSVFTEGAKDGLQTAVRILPILVIVISATSMFLSSGASNLLARLLSPLFAFLKMPSELFPLAVLRPFSGGGAISYMSELISKFGADSKIGIMAAIMTTSTETTFYTLAIYTGGKRIEGMWKILVSALLADITAVAAAVTYVNFFE